MYLACQKYMSSRTELVSLFWPEAKDDSEGRRRLRETLAKLRSQLPDPTVLVVEQDRVGLQLSKVYIDYVEFNRLAQETLRLRQHQPLQVPLPATARADLTRAVALWRSPTFMVGMSGVKSPELENWIQVTGQKVGETRLQLLEYLADDAETTGALEQAIHWLRLAIEADNLDERLHIRLLRDMIALGKKSDALEYLNNLQAFLRREKIDPSPELLRLYIDLRRKDEILTKNTQTTWETAHPLHVPLVGREDDLKNLINDFHRGGCVMVLGEAGVGKTRLVQELHRALQPAPRLLLCKASDQEGDLPFQPWLEMIRQTVSPKEWNQLGEVYRSYLGPLTPDRQMKAAPEVAAWAATLGDGEIPGLVQRNIFEALYQLLLILSGENRILFVLEDAQWSDRASFLALAYLIEREFFLSRGLLVIISRVGPPHHIYSNLSEKLGKKLKRLDLALLNRQDVDYLTRYVLDKKLELFQVDRLFEYTGGNPLFLLETLRMMLEMPDDFAPFARDSQYPLADSVRTLILNRARRFSPSAYRVITAAAVVGFRFTPDDLENVTRMDPEHVVLALEEIERSHLVRIPHRDDPDLFYHFIHDQVREALLSDMSTARLRLFHLRAAEALLARRSGQVLPVAAVLAGHYMAAGEGEIAFSFWLRAAEYAWQTFSRAETYHAFEQAEAILTRTEELVTDWMVYQLFAGWGQVAYCLNDLQTLDHIYSTAYRIGEKRGSSLLMGSALSGMADLYYLVDRWAEIPELVRKARFYLEEAGDAFELMQLNYHQACYYVLEMKFDDAVRLYKTCLSMRCETADKRFASLLAKIKYWLGSTYLFMGWPQHAAELARSTIEDYNAERDHPGKLQNYALLISAEYNLGDFKSSAEHAAAACKLAITTQNWRYYALANLILARIAFIEGNIDRSWQLAQQAYASGEEHQFRYLISEGLSIQAEIFRFFGDNNRAIEMFVRSIEYARDPLQKAEQTARLGLAKVLAGDVDAGMKLIGEVNDFAGRVGAGTISVRAGLCWIDGLVQQGAIQPALEYCDKLLDFIDKRKIEYGKTSVEYFRLRLQNDRVESETRDEILRIIRRAAEMENIWLELEILKLALNTPGWQEEQRSGFAQRVEALFASIDPKITISEVRPLYQAYRQGFGEVAFCAGH